MVMGKYFYKNVYNKLIILFVLKNSKHTEWINLAFVLLYENYRLLLNIYP